MISGFSEDEIKRYFPGYVKNPILLTKSEERQLGQIRDGLYCRIQRLNSFLDGNGIEISEDIIKKDIGRLNSKYNSLTNFVVNKNINLIYYNVFLGNKKYPQIPIDDLISRFNEKFFKLWHERKWDWKRNVKISTYATIGFNFELKAILRDNSKRFSYLSTKRGKKKMVYTNNCLDSFNLNSNESGECFIENSSSINPLSESMLNERNSIITEVISELDSNRKYLISEYFLGKKGRRTLEDLGKEFNVTKEAIRQRILKAFKEMNNLLTKRGFSLEDLTNIS